MSNRVSIDILSSSLSVLTVLEFFDSYLVALVPVLVESKF